MIYGKIENKFGLSNSSFYLFGHGDDRTSFFEKEIEFFWARAIEEISYYGQEALWRIYRFEFMKMLGSMSNSYTMAIPACAINISDDAIDEVYNKIDKSKFHVIRVVMRKRYDSSKYTPLAVGVIPEDKEYEDLCKDAVRGLQIFILKDFLSKLPMYREEEKYEEDKQIFRATYKLEKYISDLQELYSKQ